MFKKKKIQDTFEENILENNDEKTGKRPKEKTKKKRKNKTKYLISLAVIIIFILVLIVIGIIINNNQKKLKPTIEAGETLTDKTTDIETVVTSIEVLDEISGLEAGEGNKFLAVTFIYTNNSNEPIEWEKLPMSKLCYYDSYEENAYIVNTITETNNEALRFHSILNAIDLTQVLEALPAGESRMDADVYLVKESDLTKYGVFIEFDIYNNSVPFKYDPNTIPAQTDDNTNVKE